MIDGGAFMTGGTTQDQFIEQFPTMGFVRITARRTDEPTIRFGPGRFTTRIA